MLARLASLLPLSLVLAGGATLEQLSLEDLARESTAIVQGRVSGESAVQAGPLLYTVKTVAVTRSWKGEAVKTLEVALPGGALDGQQQRFGGAPLLEPNTDYILFLWTGPSGRTQITGFSQGVCELRIVADGSRHVVRGPSSDVLLAPDGSSAAGDALDLPLDVFTQRVSAAVAGAAAP